MPYSKSTRTLPKRTIKQAIQRMILTQVVVSAFLLSVLWAGSALLVAHLETLTPHPPYIHTYTP